MDTMRQRILVIDDDASLAEMLTVQDVTQTNGFGLGFSLGRYRDHRTLGHLGAVYGFTSAVIGLPQERLGVVVLASDACESADLVVTPDDLPNLRRLAGDGLREKWEFYGRFEELRREAKGRLGAFA